MRQTVAALSLGLVLAGPAVVRVQEASPRSSGEVLVRLETPHGNIVIAVDTERAPITAANFLRYVDGGFYDGGRFHRATREDNYTPNPPNRPMMNIIQGGINPDRQRDGFDPIPLERTSVTGITHVRGVVSMARGTGADTARSDFFILLDDQPSLDFGGMRFDDGQGGGAFGRVVQGLDVVEKIQQQPVEGQSLTPPVPITRAVRVGGGSVVVRVVDDKGRWPLPGVRVVLCSSPLRRGVTSSDGRIVFASVPEGRYAVDLRLTGFHLFTSTAEVVPNQEATVSAVMVANPNGAVSVRAGSDQVMEDPESFPAVCAGR